VTNPKRVMKMRYRCERVRVYLSARIPPMAWGGGGPWVDFGRPGAISIFAALPYQSPYQSSA